MRHLERILPDEEPPSSMQTRQPFAEEQCGVEGRQHFTDTVLFASNEWLEKVANFSRSNGLLFEVAFRIFDVVTKSSVR